MKIMRIAFIAVLVLPLISAGCTATSGGGNGGYSYGGYSGSNY